ncbi:DUF2716 domain-containing protein [Catellatospora sp. NPDC049609]|uniref:DUF2716 domain-containing protein n=1 Tax=Catellatospora sp. NPDC049609 TaxID=3155505 RepID=UPI0034157829
MSDPPPHPAPAAIDQAPAVVDEVWLELDWEDGRRLWAEFVQRFGFRHGFGVDAGDGPAIEEPAPSAVWDLAGVFAGTCPGGFAAGRLAIAEIVLGTLRDCTEWYESVVFHDWVHPSAVFRPHKVAGPREVPGWEIGGLLPDGDFMIFLGRDDAFGVVGDPWEQTLCVFGAPAVAAFEARSRGHLPPPIRRDGRPLP